MSKPQNNSKHNSDKITQALTLKIYFEKYLHTQKFSSVEDYIECFYSVRGKTCKIQHFGQWCFVKNRENGNAFRAANHKNRKFLPHTCTRFHFFAFTHPSHIAGTNNPNSSISYYHESTLATDKHNEVHKYTFLHLHEYFKYWINSYTFAHQSRRLWLPLHGSASSPVS